MKNYQSIINLNIYELLKIISWIEYIIINSNEKKSYIFTKFKFFIIYYKYSIIFLIINFINFGNLGIYMSHESAVMRLVAI